MTDRRFHYIVENGPRGRSDRAFARWLLAIVLASNGEADATGRARDIIPCAAEDFAKMPIAEVNGVAVAMYIAWSGAPAWRQRRIAAAFGLEEDTAVEVLAATASSLTAAPAFREAVTALSLAVREAMLARVG